MTSTKSFSLHTIAVALGAVLLLGITLEPAMAKVRPVPPPPTPSCSFTGNEDDSLTLSATGLVARYPKAEAKTDVVVTLDGNTIAFARIQSDSYVATFTAPGDYTATFKKTTSGAALKASCSGTIEDPVVPDTTPPVLNTLDIQVEATGPTTAVAYSVTATDDVDGNVTPVCVPESGSAFRLGQTTVDCEVQDNAGNVTWGSFVVTVVDTTAPVVTGADIQREATGGTTVIHVTATATDAVDGTWTLQGFNCTSGFWFGVGTETVTCGAVDLSGNYGYGSFTVTVTDTTAPVLTLPDDFSVDATSSSGAVVTWEATATDLVDFIVAVVCDPASGSELAEGTTTVNCSAMDDFGNVASGSFLVTVNGFVDPDTTDPVLTLPENITVEATGPGTVVTWEATATDDVSGNVTAFCDPEPFRTFPLGQTTVNCWATDQAGNVGSGSFTVTVTDTTGPVLTLPDTIMLDATGPDGAMVTWEATATDAVDGDVDVFCNPTSGYTETAGNARTVFCSGVDTNGNSTPGSFRVEVTHWDFPATCAWSIDPFTGGYSIRVDAVDLVEDRSSTFEVTRNGVLLFAPRVFTASGRFGVEDGTDAAIVDPVGSDSAPAPGTYIAMYTVSSTGQYQTACHIIIA